MPLDGGLCADLWPGIGMIRITSEDIRVPAEADGNLGTLSPAIPEKLEDGVQIGRAHV